MKAFLALEETLEALCEVRCHDQASRQRNRQFCYGDYHWNTMKAKISGTNFQVDAVTTWDNKSSHALDPLVNTTSDLPPESSGFILS